MYRFAFAPCILALGLLGITCSSQYNLLIICRPALSCEFTVGVKLKFALLCCSWIDLGHACASEIQPHSDNTTFLDIFDYRALNSTTGPCEPGFTSINSGEPLQLDH